MNKTGTVRPSVNNQLIQKVAMQINESTKSRPATQGTVEKA